jgi:hypothetical protein
MAREVRNRNNAGDLNVMAAVASFEYDLIIHSTNVPEVESPFKNPWRQLSTHLMRQLLKDYGSEFPMGSKSANVVSEPAVRRRFRKWNPNFFKYFHLDVETLKWYPRLGKDREIARRELWRQRNIQVGGNHEKLARQEPNKTPDHLSG